jgi:hypothetical protein
MERLSYLDMRKLGVEEAELEIDISRQEPSEPRD